MSGHYPLLYGSRYGCWCVCVCGRWQSGLYTTITGAHIAFGLRHLLDEARRLCPVCGRRTNNDVDVSQGYCGWCHAWNLPGDPDPSDDKVTWA